jgi:kumamolisin
MKRKGLSLAVVSLAAAIALVGASQLLAQGRGHVVVPDSSVEHAQDVGLRAHTNHLLFVPEKPGGPGPTASSPTGFTPSGIRAAYNLTTIGGNGVIAIVDAYDYPTAYSDFDYFSSPTTGFGLPLSSRHGAVCPDRSGGSQVKQLQRSLRRSG